jgi:ferredoxin-type protein NapH
MKRQGIHWTRWRRAIQIVIVLFYIALPLANARGFTAINGTLAALKIGRIDLIEPSSALSAMLAGRHITRVFLLGIAPVVVLALVFGPVFCSWICPWGLVSEFVVKFRRRGWKGRPWLTLRRTRLVSLTAWLAASALLAIPLVALFSAPRLITSLPLEAIWLRMLSPVTAGILLALLVLEMVGPKRIWCRALCPTGAMANYLRTGATLKVVAGGQCACPTEPQCFAQCRWGLDPRAIRRFDGCTNCMRCVEVCPTGALNPGFHHGS